MPFCGRGTLLAITACSSIESPDVLYVHYREIRLYYAGENWHIDIRQLPIFNYIVFSSIQTFFLTHYNL